MILRPVRPVSPWGPPITNFPVGLIWYLIFLLKRWLYAGYWACTRGMRMLIISLLILAAIFSSVSKSSCWVEMTMASIRMGLLLSSYSMVTWDLASGLRYLISLFS